MFGFSKSFALGSIIRCLFKSSRKVPVREEVKSEDARFHSFNKRAIVRATSGNCSGPMKTSIKTPRMTKCVKLNPNMIKR